jgi:hypothetical protein
MKWNHLPVPGGIYAQHPRLIDDFSIIFAAVHKREKLEADRQKAEADAARAKSRSKR